MAQPFYTSSEAVKLVLQPDLPIRRPTAPANYNVPSYQPPSKFQKPWGQPEYSSLLKPSLVRAVSGLPPPPPLYEPRLQLQRRIVSAATHRKPQIPLNHSPFAQRAVSAPLSGGGGGGLAVAKAAVPAYNSLYDPHLTDYFARKVSAESLGLSTRRQPQDVYKVTVTTGHSKTAGTTAEIFLRINGSKGKFPKTRLHKKKGLINTVNGKKYRFAPSSVITFVLKGPPIGDIKSIVIENDGMEKKDGWFLDNIDIALANSKKRWYFPCNKWLSLYESDGHNSRELFPETRLDSGHEIDYEVEVDTADKFGAGTDSNVFVTLYGENRSTPRLHLHSSNNPNPFERGQTDRFKLKSIDVGPLEKLRIEHDNTGSAPGWKLDVVRVIDTKAKRTYTFPCHQWLAKNEGDGRILRDLLPNDSRGKSGSATNYVVKVFTADKRQGGTDANVFLTIFGDKGESGELELKGPGNNFERGATDEFTFALPNCGRLKRVRIRHDNSGVGSGWFLDKISINDTQSGKTYNFPCNRWLAKDEDDGKISRELMCDGVDGKDSLLVPYEIKVVTGDLRGAGTDANVYVELHGKGDKRNRDASESSGRIALEGGKFERGKTDVIHTEIGAMLSPLAYITIGHDNKGAAAGWYLEKVIVTCGVTGLEQHFPCKQWLAKDEGDGLIERDLHEDKSFRKSKEKGVPWDVAVHTSDLRGGGTDANVFVVVYGDKGKSEVIELEGESNKFERGQTDKFAIETGEIGRPFKLRIWHDNKGTAAGWHLNSVEMTNRLTGQKYEFPCDRWLATDEDDGEIIRELPATGGDVRKPLPMAKYSVRVHTGSKRGAGTDADIYACLFGAMGDTGDRPLKKSLTNRNKFEKGQVDEFIIEAVSLKQLEKLRIGHNGKGAGAGWFLDKVVVTDTNGKQPEATFNCQRWLAEDEDDGQIVRELFCGEQSLLSTTQYVVSVKTGDVKNAGTDANVYLLLFGKHGGTDKLMLKKSENTKDPFERDRTDIFKIEASDIGKIKRLKIGHDGKGVGAGWFLENVEVKIPSKGEIYNFVAHRWLASDEEDGELEVELYPTEIKEGNATIPYEITIATGDVKGAGTDANVFLQIYGSEGKTEVKNLRNKTDNFEKGAVDKFKIDDVDVGKITKIRVGHDGKGFGAGWFLDKIEIRKPVTERSKKRRKSSKSGRSAKDSDSDDTKHHRKRSTRKHSKYSDSESDTEPKRPQSSLRRSSSKSRKSEIDSDSDDMKRNGKKNKKKSKYSDSESETEQKRPKSSLKRSSSKSRKFSVDSDSDDMLKRSKSSMKKSSKSSRKDPDADTNSNETVSEDNSSLESKSSAKRKSSLKRTNSSHSLNGHKSTRKTSKHSKNHSNSDDSDSHKKGGNKSNRKSVSDDQVETYYFVVRRWFDKREDDGQIVRELVPTDEDGKTLESNLLDTQKYEVHVYTGDVFGAGTDANVFVNVYGENGDTGERQLKESQNRNKFERNAEDIFTLEAAELGKLKKVKVWHDNAGAGAAWHLDRIEVVDVNSGERWIFSCENWLSTKKGDGQICRELVPVSAGQLKRLKRNKSSSSLKEELGLELSANLTPFNVKVITGKKRGAGTDANVYIVLYGENENTGKVMLKHSKTNSNKFESGQTDEFVVEAVDIGDLNKILIGHDNAGGFADWYLEAVVIDAPTLGKSWTFACDRWLAKGKDDGLLERELFPTKTDTFEACVPHEIVVHTSDQRGAGTDADVFVKIYGEDGKSTRQISLCPEKKDRKDKFERGSVDKFIVELEDVGMIAKLRIGHDNSGVGPGWHLDKVEIKKLLTKGKGSVLYTFPCQKWFAKNEGDGLIVRDLIPTGILEEKVKRDGSVKKKHHSEDRSTEIKSYEIRVHTGDVSMAGTDANVHICIHGDKGDSGTIPLKKSSTNMNKFERNQVDIFKIDCADLGRLQKIDIGHDDSLLNSDWFLSHVEITDLTTVKTYRFPCAKWLARKKDDGKIERTLVAEGADLNASQRSLRRDQKISGKGRLLDETSDDVEMVPYTIRIKTGDKKDAGSEAQCWMQIFGSDKRKTTGRLLLEILGRKHKFLPGTEEIFSVDAPYISKIQEIKLAIDYQDDSDSWFVEEVEILQPTKDKSYFFPVNKWFSETKSDGKTSRTLIPDDSASSVKRKSGVKLYEAHIYTGNMKGSSTDSDIWLQLIGTDNSTPKIPFNKVNDRFERGKSDIIKIERIKVGSTCSGSRPDWFLDKIDLFDLKADKEYNFDCNNWLSKVEGDGKTVRELSAKNQHRKDSKSSKTTSYQITVKTADVRGAGTDANVFCNLTGEWGETGEIPLEHSETNKNKFERGQTDVFRFDNVPNVGQLKKLRVWHDDSGMGSAWYLDSIEVADLNSKKSQFFPCNQWLSATDGDGKLSKTLYCEESKSATNSRENLRDSGETKAYDITIVTGDKREAGTSHNCLLVIEGSKRTSEELLIPNSSKRKMLGRGQTDKLKFESKELGTLKSILIGLAINESIEVNRSPESDRENSWYCSDITICPIGSTKSYSFPVRSWVPLSKNGTEMVKIECSSNDNLNSSMRGKKGGGHVRYTFTIVTGNDRGAGTDAKIYANLIGINGESGSIQLTEGQTDEFERGKIDQFAIDLPDLGKLKRLVIGHDNTGDNAGWQLDKVTVANGTTGEKTTFPCQMWLDKKKGDRQIVRELKPQ